MSKKFCFDVEQVFGRLTLVQNMGKNESGHIIWLCRCSCGNERIVRQTDLNTGRVDRCHSCTKKTELLNENPLYKVWSVMKSRCNDTTNQYYGSRGITYQENWEDFEPFQEWALKNGYTPFMDLSIERKNVNGNYEESNCCWIPRCEQSRNTRRNCYLTINGETKLKSDWSKIAGISSSAMDYRIEHGWDDLLSPKTRRGKELM